MRVAKLFASGVLVLMLSSNGRLFGQGPNETLVTTFSEDFIVGTTVLPKGEYQISNPSPVAPLLRFFSSDRMRYEAFTLAIRATTDNLRPSDDTKLVFEKIGSKYHLTQIWVYGQANGLEIPLSGRARSLKRELELAGKQPEFRVVLATAPGGHAPKSLSR